MEAYMNSVTRKGKSQNTVYCTDNDDDHDDDDHDGDDNDDSDE